MSSLDATFAELRRRLSSPDRMSATRTDPFFHFVHAPEDTPTLVDGIRRWKASLEADGWKVRIVSLADEMWRVIDASGRWGDWLELEPEASRAEAVEAVAGALQSEGLSASLLALVTDPTPGRLLLLTDAALLHPFFRVRVIEESVHDQVMAPTVLFYPGRRIGEYGLSFLGFYPEDPNYRSTVVGGEP